MPINKYTCFVITIWEDKGVILITPKGDIFILLIMCIFTVILGNVSLVLFVLWFGMRLK